VVSRQARKWKRKRQTSRSVIPPIDRSRTSLARRHGPNRLQRVPNTHEIVVPSAVRKIFGPSPRISGRTPNLTKPISFYYCNRWRSPSSTLCAGIQYVNDGVRPIIAPTFFDTQTRRCRRQKRNASRARRKQ